jgi:hypothetical protein
MDLVLGRKFLMGEKRHFPDPYFGDGKASGGQPTPRADYGRGNTV